MKQFMRVVGLVVAYVVAIGLAIAFRFWLDSQGKLATVVVGW